MRSLLLALSIVALSFVISSCTKSNPAYCDESSACDCDLERHVCREADAAPPSADAATCMSSQDCTEPNAPICDNNDQICRACGPRGMASPECMLLDNSRPICADDGRCGECVLDDDCVASSTAPICGQDLTCRACQSSGECTDAVRDQCGPDGRCVECALHGDCSTAACDVAAGSCVTESDIVYVGGSNASNSSGCGSPTSPCATISFGLSELGNRGYLVVRPGNYSDNVDVDNVDVHIVGLGANLSALSSGTPVIQVRNGADVTIYGLSIRSAISAAGIGCTGSTTKLTLQSGTRVFFNMGNGVDSSSCSLTVIESSIDSNIQIGLRVSGGSLTMRGSTLSGNQAGGVYLSGVLYEIINNFVVNNGTGGSSGSNIAGMRIDNAVEAGDQILAFNTIADNQAASGVNSGVYCDVSGSAITKITSNIVYNVGGATNVVSGNCVWHYSNYQGAPVGTRNNIDSNPLFKDRSAGNFELTMGSPCKDKGETLPVIPTDYEGDARPDGAYDIGADEIDP